MKIETVYSQYQTPPNLQDHLLRVASISQIIAESTTNPDVNVEDIRKAALLHDIAKPMNFDLAKQAQFGMSPEDIDKLANLQKTLKEKYGSDEHQATVQICNELGLSENAVKLVDNLEWSYVPKLLESNETESLILIYADMRIGPKGVLTLKQRHEDLVKRETVENYDERVQNSLNLESYIAKIASIDLNKISDEDINVKVEELRDSEI